MKKFVVVLALFMTSCVCFDGAHTKAVDQVKVDLSVAVGVERLLNEGKLTDKEKDEYIKEHVLSLKQLKKTLEN